MNSDWMISFKVMHQSNVSGVKGLEYICCLYTNSSGLTEMFTKQPPEKSQDICDLEKKKKLAELTLRCKRVIGKNDDMLFYKLL